MKASVLGFAVLAFLPFSPASAQTYTFSLLAGLARVPGSFDGPGANSRFNGPTGVAVDHLGNVYVADTNNHVIRKIVPGGLVSTYAGSAGNKGSADGPVAQALFYGPFGLAIDAADNLYVAEAGNHAVRKITAAGNVSTIAGLAGTTGSDDGIGSAARFGQLAGIAVDRAGALYVTEALSCTIRKITADGQVTTLAGLAGLSGSADGSGSNARFRNPAGVAVDGTGNVYVSDSNNHTIRKISPAGDVVTVAGFVGQTGHADGTGTSARFYTPFGLAFDRAGNLIIAEFNNHTLRRMTPSGAVSTLAGVATIPGFDDGTGVSASFTEPSYLAFDAAGVLYVTDMANQMIRRGVPDSGFPPPVIATQPASLDFIPGSQASFFVTAVGLGVSYQWRKDGVDLPGATDSTYVVPDVKASDAGSYSVVVRNAGGVVTSDPARLTVTPAPASRLVNLSVRANAGTGDGTLIAGFIVDHADTMGVLLRGIGPGLAQSIPGFLADPRLVFFRGQQFIAQNDDWETGSDRGSFDAVGAFPLPAGSKDAALGAGFGPGLYTMHVTSSAGTGVALAEIYYSNGNARLTNLSARATVGTGDKTLIAGFIIAGTAPKTLLIRGVGPALAGFGVSGVLGNPRLTLYNEASHPIQENDDWGGGAALTSAFAQVGAFPLPGDSKDAALLVTLAPGLYTAQVSGVGETTGNALVEIYEVQ